MDYIIIIIYKFHNFIHSCNQLASAGKDSSEPMMMLVWVQGVFQIIIIMNVAKNNICSSILQEDMHIVE